MTDWKVSDIEMIINNITRKVIRMLVNSGQCETFNQYIQLYLDICLYIFLFILY